MSPTRNATFLALVSLTAVHLALACSGPREYDDDGTGGSSEDGGGEGGDSGSGGAPVVPGVPSILDVVVDGKSLRDGPLVGAASDATIVVHFSEPMDKVATQTAYNSASDSLSASQVTFSWNSAGTELTIVPNDPLPYREVDDPTADAEAFTFRISTAAATSEGIEMEEEFSATFTTYKRVTQLIAPDNENSSRVAYFDKDPVPSALAVSDPTLCVHPDDDDNPEFDGAEFTTHLGFTPDAYYPGSPGRHGTSGVRASIYSFELTGIPAVEVLVARLALGIFRRSTPVIWSELDSPTQQMVVFQLESEELDVDTIDHTIGAAIPLEGTEAEQADDYGLYAYDVLDRARTSLEDEDRWLTFRTNIDQHVAGAPSQFLCVSMSLTLVYLAP